jgi:hypothetical protein
MLPQAPQLCAIANGSRAARICIGSDNPDNLYENAVIDGRREYVVHGVRGTVAYLGLGTQSGAYGAKGGLATVDFAEAETLQYDDEARTWLGWWLGLGLGLGSGLKLGCRNPNPNPNPNPSPNQARTRFTLVLSATRPAHATNWLRLVPGPPLSDALPPLRDPLPLPCPYRAALVRIEGLLSIHDTHDIPRGGRRAGAAW